MTINVLLADDHAVLCDGLRSLLDAQSDMHVVGRAADGRDAVRQVGALHPDVVLMDIAMPGLNGIEAAKHVCTEHPSTRVVMLSMHASSEHIYRALKAGATGFLLKESAGWEVVDAVRAVHTGRRYLSHSIEALALDDSMTKRPSVSPVESLSQREREILQLVVEGKSSAEIGQMLFLSPKTVESYRSRLMQKLSVGDVPSLVRFAIHHGLIA